MMGTLRIQGDVKWALQLTPELHQRNAESSVRSGQQKYYGRSKGSLVRTYHISCTEYAAPQYPITLKHCLHLVQVFRELDAADDEQAGDAAYLSDGSQSEADEPAFSPAHSRGHGRGGQRRRLQVDLYAFRAPGLQCMS